MFHNLIALLLLLDVVKTITKIKIGIGLLIPFRSIIGTFEKNCTWIKILV